MAAVWTGAALPVAEVEAELAASLAELALEAAELVRLSRSEEREAAADPVAVARTEEMLEAALPASVLMELTTEPSEELTESSSLRIELETLAAELIAELRALPSVVVVSWAAARATKPAMMGAKRILNEGFFFFFECGIGKWFVRRG